MLQSHLITTTVQRRAVAEKQGRSTPETLKVKFTMETSEVVTGKGQKVAVWTIPKSIQNACFKGNEAKRKFHEVQPICFSWMIHSILRDWRQHWFPRIAAASDRKVALDVKPHWTAEWRSADRSASILLLRGRSYSRKPILTSIPQNWMNHSGKTDWLDLVKLSLCFISLKASILELFRDISDSITHGWVYWCISYPSGICLSVCLSVCVSVHKSLWQRTLANALHQFVYKLFF